jgi:hypothetical protein
VKRVKKRHEIKKPAKSQFGGVNLNVIESFVGKKGIWLEMGDIKRV